MGFFDSKAGQATIGAAGSLGVSFVNNLFAQKAATKQYQRQVDFWKMQNDYNHPLQQRHRLAQAGLNPAAAAGDIAQGNTAGAASSVPGNEYAQQGVIDPNSFVDSLKALAEIENISANSSLLTQKVATEYLNTILKQLGIDEQQIENSMKRIRLSQYKDELDAQMEEIRSRGFYQYAMGNSVETKLPYEIDSLQAGADAHRADTNLKNAQASYAAAQAALVTVQSANYTKEVNARIRSLDASAAASLQQAEYYRNNAQLLSNQNELAEYKKIHEDNIRIVSDVLGFEISDLPPVTQVELQRAVNDLQQGKITDVQFNERVSDIIYTANTAATAVMGTKTQQSSTSYETKSSGTPINFNKAKKY